jgi:kynurenine formamidase
VIGIDAYTLDWPFASMVADYGPFEKLENLDLIPRPHGFYVACLPVKIKGASAGWCRAVALVLD